MKKRKIITICVFLLLISFTVIYTLVSAVNSYRFDMDPANGVDIMEGVEAALILMVGGFFTFYELDLFYTVYYLITKPRRGAKSILNIISNLCLLLTFFGNYYDHLFAEDGVVYLILLAVYMILRAVHFLIPGGNLKKEQ